MMQACNPTTATSEMLFAQAYLARRESGNCAGPMLTMVLDDWRVFILQRILASDLANDLLWKGFLSADHCGSTFGLCAAHWFDVASLAFTHAVGCQRVDWLHHAQELLHDLCVLARWDAKEIVNMFAWQQQG
jgi:hypothetical protein